MYRFLYVCYVILLYFKDKELKKLIINNRNHISYLEKRIDNIDNIKQKNVSEIDLGLKTKLEFAGYLLYFVISCLETISVI